MKRLRLGLWFLALFALGGGVSARAEDSRLDTILKRDKLLVGVISTSAPVGFVDEDGKLTGFEIEFARLIAKSILGSPDKIDFVPVTGDGRFPAVLSGRVDFGVASTTIYPDRAVRVAFTRPYLDSTTYVAVLKDSPIHAIEELNKPEIKLGSTNSAAMVDRAKRYAPLAQAVYFDTDSAAFQALRSGRISAAQGDSAQIDYLVARSNGAIVRLPGNLGNLNGNAVFMKPGDFQLWLCLDTIVGEYVSGSRYDEYQALYQKWFGRAPPPARFYASH